MAVSTVRSFVDQDVSSCGYSRAEIRTYLEWTRVDCKLPIYWHDKGLWRTPMTALVPPYLEEAFADARHVRDRFAMYPHALLTRDFGPLDDVNEVDWWCELWGAGEVEEAQRNKRVLVDERREHDDVVIAHRGRRESGYRVCSMADSFDRGESLQRSFDMWLWRPFYSNPYGFSSLACLVNMVRMKQMLWQRYHFFFNPDTLQEVYPESELASWVIFAWENDGIAVPEWRDEELSYEALNSSFVAPWPREIRAFEEEVLVQNRRSHWRNMIVYSYAGNSSYKSHVDRRIYAGEELPRCLIEEDEEMEAFRRSYWENRRAPKREDHEALEVGPATWKTEPKVSQMNAIAHRFCCFSS